MRLSFILAFALAGCDGGSGDDTPPPTTLVDLEFQAYVDVDQDGLSFNDEPRALRFSEYFANNRPGTKIIMINAAAGWCSPCMNEASAIPGFVEAYGPRGVVIMTAVFQDQNGMPADANFSKLWAESFQLPIPVLIDSSFATSKYFDVSAMPANMFVDAQSLEILSIATGADTGADPLKAYRELLDFYLE